MKEAMPSDENIKKAAQILGVDASAVRSALTQGEGREPTHRDMAYFGASEAAGYQEAAERLAQAVNAFRKLDQLMNSPLRETDEYIELCLAWSALADNYPAFRSRASDAIPNPQRQPDD